MTAEQWADAFHRVEASLIQDGYTCEDLAPVGTLPSGETKKCIACLTSMRLRGLLLNA